MSRLGVQSSVKDSGLELLSELYRRSRGAEFGLTRDAFNCILQEVTKKYLPADASGLERQQLLLSLRVEELALARACAAGHERAWEVFLTRYREKLYDVATYIAKEASAGRELADCLYADLYGTSLRDGQRVSKLASYTGRGSLEGWLRTVLAQEHVNGYRRRRRLVSLEEESEQGVQFAAATSEPVREVDPKIEAATDDALAELSSEDRFVLASYYLDSRTLAEIARILRVHESTISRKLDKLAKSLRKRILAGLGRRGMSRRQAEEALEVDVRDLHLNLRNRLVQETAHPPFSKKNAEAAGKGPA
ncbi:MAG TPA: sigma-70 family RNA polymerase sigma factor [Terriglobales bacterium]|nr:sigma-70 family RNA polymerase sigma factor [Terriglobales bacterium]